MPDYKQQNVAHVDFENFRIAKEMLGYSANAKPKDISQELHDLITKGISPQPKEPDMFLNPPSQFSIDRELSKAADLYCQASEAERNENVNREKERICDAMLRTIQTNKDDADDISERLVLMLTNVDNFELLNKLVRAVYKSDEKKLMAIFCECVYAATEKVASQRAEDFVDGGEK